jgi:glycosyltransferase involved in cell wall biosynthesis
MESIAYLSASHVVWTTEDQKKRGMSIARHFLPSNELLRLSRRNSVIGHGISDLLRPHKISDDEVKRKLQAKKEGFKVTFLGRITRNKNIGFICDTVKNLYAMHGTELELNLSVSKAARAARDAAGQDVLNIISDERFCGGFVPRERYASELLPETQCLMYASLAEGYCITPREAVYIGVPAIVPRVPWAVAAFGPDYPFYYVGKEEAFALIRRIEEGAVTDEEAARFLSVRDNGYSCEFVSQTSMKLFSVFTMLADVMRSAYASIAHSRLTDVFERSFDLGDEFTMSDFGNAVEASGMKITNGYSRRAITLFELYAFFGSRLECVNPFRGKFCRVT